MREPGSGTNRRNDPEYVFVTPPPPRRVAWILAGVTPGNWVVNCPNQFEAPAESLAKPLAESVSVVPVTVGVRIMGDPAEGEQTG
jgi:hypothetical protein